VRVSRVWIDVGVKLRCSGFDSFEFVGKLPTEPDSAKDGKELARFEREILFTFEIKGLEDAKRGEWKLEPKFGNWREGDKKKEPNLFWNGDIEANEPCLLLGCCELFSLEKAE